MNLFYRLLSDVANALVSLWRWVTALEEIRPDPYYLSRYKAWTDEPAAVALAWSFPAGRAPVSLVKAPSLVRPFVGQLSGPSRPATVDLAKRVAAARQQVATATRVVGRAAVTVQAQVATAMRLPGSDWYVDELGLPRERMATGATPTVGIFEHTLDAWKRTGRGNAIQWA